VTPVLKPAVFTKFTHSLHFPYRTSYAAMYQESLQVAGLQVAVYNCSRITHHAIQNYGLRITFSSRG
jgi:hypothetical protein